MKRALALGLALGLAACGAYRAPISPYDSDDMGASGGGGGTVMQSGGAGGTGGARDASGAGGVGEATDSGGRAGDMGAAGDAVAPPWGPPRAVDLLFMIDNSLTMTTKQVELARVIPIFLRELRTQPGGGPDLRIGVVTSDLGAGTADVGTCSGYGDRAAFQVNDLAGKNCGLVGGLPYFVSSNQGATTNLAPGKTAADVVACMVLRSSNGCGFEHQLQATRLALIPQSVNPENVDFLRPGALLAIVLLTDEDDCSAPPDPKYRTFFNATPVNQATYSFRCNTDGHQCGGKPVTVDPTLNFPLAQCMPIDKPVNLIPVSDFVDDINALKPPGTARIVVSAITGVPLLGMESSARYAVQKNQSMSNGIAAACSSRTFGSADPALRIKRFVDSFGSNGATYSICQDMGLAVQQIAGRILGTTTAP